MENQVNSKNIIINNGLYYGLVLIMASLITYTLDMHLKPIGGYINFAVVSFVLIVFPIIGMSQFKKQNGGFMNWGQGVKIGMGIVLIGTLLSIIYQYIFTTFIEPEFYTQLGKITRNGLVDAGLSEEQIDMQMNMQSKFQGTAIGYAVGILFFAFLGFVSSAIIAAVKKKSEEEHY